MRESQIKPTLRHRFRYWFDNLMSRGAIAVIMWLAILSFVIVMLAGIVTTVFNILPDGEESMPFFEAVWRGLMRTFDAGTMGGDNGWGYRWVMLLVTLGGIFVVSALIGVINNAIGNKIEELRKGHSKVIESGHTLILGWSPKIFTIISELCIANKNRRRPRIVVLADRDKVEMEDDIRAHIPNTSNTRVICRSGSVINHSHLAVVNPHGARSIIVLTPETDNPDIHVIKTVMAINNQSGETHPGFHIVSEITRPKNLQVTGLVGKNNASFILSKDIISRLVVQTCRQSGVSVIFTELLNFEGDEIYFKQEPGLYGKTYKDALFSYCTSAVMGLFLSEGKTILNPPMDTVIRKGDAVIAISHDDDAIIPSGQSGIRINESLISHDALPPRGAERILIVGWNGEGPSIISELELFAPAHSYLKVVFDFPAEFLEYLQRENTANIKQQTIEFVSGDTSDRILLESLDVPSFDHVIVLSCNDQLPTQEADALTLVTLLHLRDIRMISGKHFNIVSEMLDVRNRELAAVSDADDFIVSDRLISLLLAQLSENHFLQPVFNDLFGSGGPEICICPATSFIQTDIEIDFYTVLESAARKGQTAIGYRQTADAAEVNKNYGIHVNPRKSDRFILTCNDRIIILAENHCQ